MLKLGGPRFFSHAVYIDKQQRPLQQKCIQLCDCACQRRHSRLYTVSQKNVTIFIFVINMSDVIRFANFWQKYTRGNLQQNACL